MSKARKWFLTGLIFVLVLMLIGWDKEVQSQVKYPNRPIDIIVPWPPGGGTDLPARIIAARLNKKWGVPVNAINKPGGKCIPGVIEVYHANPDGYTLLADSQSGCSLLEAEVKNLPFKTMDRTFIAMASAIPYILIVPSTSPFKNLKEFIAEAKKNPENISWTSGSPGIEYLIRRFLNLSGLDVSKMRAVMIRGGSEAVTITAGGHVTLGASTVGTVVPAVQSGTVKPMFITYKTRYPDLPDLPTSAEMGYPALTDVHWVGISGPPKLPSYVVDIWSKVLEEMVNDPELVSQLKNVGALPFYHDQKATIEYVTKEIGEATKFLTK